ncbi:MAG: pilus assembly protein TadG-related protein [Planctomycetota bacterium]|jgi:Flp pilus assembly protein TadG
MTRRQQNRKRRGHALVWGALFIIIFAGLLGLGVDGGYVLLTAHHLQNGADSSALAAAAQVRQDQSVARQKAWELGQANDAAQAVISLDLNAANDPAGDIVLGTWDRDTQVFTPTTDGPDAVKVVARKTDGSLNGPLSLFVGHAFGMPEANVSRFAIAHNAGASGAGLITLNPSDPCTLEMNGNNTLTIQNAPGFDGEATMQIDSSDPCGWCTSGSSLEVTVTGGTNIVGGDPGVCSSGNPTLNTDVNTDQPYIPDPLAGVPEPPVLPPDLGVIQTSGNYPPGYYSGGLRATSSDTTIVLDGGVYVMDGEGVYINGGNLIANEVMFYIMGTGRLYLGGNGIVDITPSSDENDPYWGISVFQARDNTTQSVIIGTSNMNLEGSFYFPVAELEVGGTGIALGNQLVAWEMWIHGTGDFTINYDGRFPNPGFKVYLVQ